MIDIEGGVPWIVILIQKGLGEVACLVVKTSNPDVRLVRRLLPY
jgi:hypothetical protein